MIRNRFDTLFSLDGKDCRLQIVSLAAHGSILADGQRKLMPVGKRADPS